MLKISLMEGSGWYSFQPPQRVDQAARPVHFLSAVYTHDYVKSVDWVTACPVKV